VDRPPDETDEALLSRVRGGDRAAYTQLLKRYERELFGYLRRYLGRDDLAADVFQNTFLAVYSKAKQYEPGRPARPWLYAIATHAAIDAQRKEKRQKVHAAEPLPGEGEARTLLDFAVADEADPREWADLDEQKRAVRAAVDELPDGLRSVVVMAYFQGMRYQEIAESLGIPLGTVKSRMNAAVGKLGSALKAVQA
jgi:RNA polymerase sigma-70 factor (ECF subfamily)